jgi:AsmA protein
MRGVLIGLIVAVGLLVVAAALVPRFVPTEAYEAELVERAERATGRDVDIGGDVRLSILPRLALWAEDVSVANLPEGRAEPMIRAARLVVGLEPWPLLRGDLVFDRIELVEPAIHLERTADGRANWRFAGEREPARGESPIDEVRIEALRIEDGHLSYVDRADGARQELRDVDLQLAWAGADDPLEADGRAIWNGEEVTLDLRVAEPSELVDGGDSPVLVEVRAEPASLRYEGEVAGGPTATARGELRGEAPSLRRLVAWLAPGAEAPAPGALALRSRVTLDGRTLRFEETRVRVGESAASGRLRVETEGDRPRVSGALDVSRLALDPYLGPARAGRSGRSDRAAPERAARRGWSEAPIDLSGLRAVDADVDVRLADVVVRGLVLERGRLGIALKGGRLEVALRQLALYGGEARGRLWVDGSGGAPRIAVPRLSFRGIEARPLLRDAVGHDDFSGRASGEITDLRARGRSAKALMSGLEGAGRFELRDGAFTGAIPTQALGTLLAADGPQDLAKVEYARITGTFAIRGGVLANDDLEMIWPPLRVTGEGTVGIGARTVDYALVPSGVLSLEAVGLPELGRLVVPVRVRGPWDDLGWSPVWTEARAVGPDGELRSPTSELMRRLPDEVRERIPEDAFEGLLRGRVPGVEPPTPRGQAPRAPQAPLGRLEDAVRGVLGAAEEG